MFVCLMCSSVLLQCVSLLFSGLCVVVFVVLFVVGGVKVYFS